MGRWWGRGRAIESSFYKLERAATVQVLDFSNYYNFYEYKISWNDQVVF